MSSNNSQETSRRHCTNAEAEEAFLKNFSYASHVGNCEVKAKTISRKELFCKWFTVKNPQKLYSPIRKGWFLFSRHQKANSNTESEAAGKVCME